jgi:hypothetical protein
MDSLIMRKVQEIKPLFYAMVFHMYNVKELRVPLVFVATEKSLLQATLAISWFHCVRYILYLSSEQNHMPSE